jgi:hypothetical protein
MKKQFFGIPIVICGLLIAFGPQFIFKVCDSSCCCSDIPQCHWAAQAEIGIGMLIAALGLGLVIFNDSKTQLGLFIGVFLSGIIAIGFPHALIGGCEMKNMACHKIAFPAITIISIVLVVFTAIVVIYNEFKKNKETA